MAQKGKPFPEYVNSRDTAAPGPGAVYPQIRGADGEQMTYQALVDLILANAGPGGAGVTLEQVRDNMAVTLQGGTDITITPDDLNDTITIASTAAALTLEQVRDDLATVLTAGANIVITPNDGSDTITIATTGGIGITLEEVRDDLASVLTAGADITITPNDANDTITISSNAASLTRADVMPIVVPDDIDATGTPSASTSLHGDGVWRAPSSTARVSMSTPSDPQPGDTRWNLNEDPPVSTGTSFTDSDVYLASKSQLVAGTNVTIVPNDGTQKITINSSASGGTGTGVHTYLNATAYGLATNATAATNTAALKACINAAIGANRNVFIPAGRYTVNPGCITPTLGSNAIGLEVHGEGKFRTELMMATQSTTSYFYDNGTNGATCRFVTFKDIGFLGGPIETPAQRGNINPNHNFMRYYGDPDQNVKFFSCAFRSLNGIFYALGPDLASEVSFDHCKIAHIQDYVWRLDNHQALNLHCFNTDIEFCWGDVIRSEGRGGGALSFFGGSLIVQRDGTDRGCLVKMAGGPLSGTVSFVGTRIEIRNDAMLFDGTGGGGATVNFISSTSYTTIFSIAVNTVIVGDNQSVNFDKCAFDHNNSWATYTVQGTGWLVFDTCAVRPSLFNEITKTGTGKAKAINCRGRTVQGTSIDFVK